MADAEDVEGLVDMAERFADVVDAAQGRGGRKASGVRGRLILRRRGLVCKRWRPAAQRWRVERGS